MKRRKQGESGSILVEFVLSSLFWVPLLMGTFVIGLNLLRAIQVMQVCRDAGHMFAYGVDFSQTGNQNLLIRLTNGLNFSTSGGNGVVIFSTVSAIGALQCTAAGYQADTTNCPNLNQIVFTRRIVVGNSSARASNFGTPGSGTVDGNGYILASDYLTNISERATGFSTLLPLAAGQIAYLTETYLASPDIDWTNFMTGTGVYARTIF
ncbi:MAG: hypothetical protein M3Z23_02975 [Acidobacteriota bacterium]|nr:hypothetical protein [Acidobacteriota bacterium]